MAGNVELSDGVVVLRPLRMEDAADHFAGEDAELQRWLNGGPGTPATVARYITEVEAMWAAGGPIFTFAIRADANDALAGTIDVQLHQEHLEPDEANLAFGLYAPWRGLGFATRAVMLAVDFLRTLGTVQSALICADPLNAPSSSVALRAGFVLVAHAADTPDELDRYELRIP